jgi:hypothetical protein
LSTPPASSWQGLQALYLPMNAISAARLGRLVMRRRDRALTGSYSAVTLRFQSLNQGTRAR